MMVSFNKLQRKLPMHILKALEASGIVVKFEEVEVKILMPLAVNYKIKEM
jgi:hypothetical protein